MILSRYLTKAYLKYFFNSLSIASILLVIIGWMDFTARFINSDINGLFVLWLVVLKLPYLLSQILPFISLIAIFLFLANLWRSNQMVVMINSGFSFFRVSIRLFCVTTIIALFNLLILGPLGIELMNKQEALENKKLIANYNSDEFNNVVATYNYNNYRRIYNIGIFNAKDYSLRNIVITNFNFETNTYELIEASKGKIINNQLFLHNAIILQSDKKESYPDYTLVTKLTNEDLVNITKNATNSSIFDLLSVVISLDTFDIASGEYKNILYKILVKAIVIVFNALLVCYLLSKVYLDKRINYWSLLLVAILYYLIIEIIGNLVIYQFFRG